MSSLSKQAGQGVITHIFHTISRSLQATKAACQSHQIWRGPSLNKQTVKATRLYSQPHACTRTGSDSNIWAQVAWKAVGNDTRPNKTKPFGMGKHVVLSKSSRFLERKKCYKYHTSTHLSVPLGGPSIHTCVQYVCIYIYICIHIILWHKPCIQDAPQQGQQRQFHCTLNVKGNILPTVVIIFTLHLHFRGNVNPCDFPVVKLLKEPNWLQRIAATDAASHRNCNRWCKPPSRHRGHQTPCCWTMVNGHKKPMTHKGTPPQSTNEIVVFWGDHPETRINCHCKYD